MSIRIRKLLAGLLSFAMIITIPCLNVSATNNSSTDSDLFFSTSQSAQNIYERASVEKQKFNEEVFNHFFIQIQLRFCRLVNFQRS